MSVAGEKEGRNGREREECGWGNCAIKLSNSPDNDDDNDNNPGVVTVFISFSAWLSLSDLIFKVGKEKSTTS